MVDQRQPVAGVVGPHRPLRRRDVGVLAVAGTSQVLAQGRPGDVVAGIPGLHRRARFGLDPLAQALVAVVATFVSETVT